MVETANYRAILREGRWHCERLAGKGLAQFSLAKLDSHAQAVRFIDACVRMDSELTEALHAMIDDDDEPFFAVLPQILSYARRAA